METKLQILGDILKRNEYSFTKPRQAVFQLLLDQEPQSMHELFIRAKGSVDRVSLYRIIRIFEQTGIAQRVYVGWKYKIELTDIFSHHHHHISCISCNKLIAINEDAEIEKLIQEIAQKHQLKATSHQLEVQGYCSDCQKRMV
ncbi:MAG: Fur family transcriptional regulator [Candidatus Saccharimonadales bacterium]